MQNNIQNQNANNENLVRQLKELQSEVNTLQGNIRYIYENTKTGSLLKMKEKIDKLLDDTQGAYTESLNWLKSCSAEIAQIQTINAICTTGLGVIWMLLFSPE